MVGNDTGPCGGFADYGAEDFDRCRSISTAGWAGHGNCLAVS